MPVNTSFGRLWPHCDAKNHLVTVVAPISGARFPVHSGIAPLVAEGLRRMELGIGGPAYILDPSQCGAYNCRKIAGTNSPSNHSGGLALDKDWRRNPFKKGARYALPEWVWKMWEWLGFYWGGRYHDYMHTEWLKTPSAARARMVELGLLSGGGGSKPSSSALRLGSQGPEVRRLQELLRIEIDGSFGPATEKAVKLFQQQNGLEADGICGLSTWAKLLTENEDDMAQVEQWKFDRLFDRILSMSAGVEGQNNDGGQFGYEKRRWEALDERLDKIETALAALKRP